MKHRKSGRKFSREKGAREAMMKIMTGQLLDHGKLRTTEAKAKSLKGILEKLLVRAANVQRGKSNSAVTFARYIKTILPKSITLEKIIAVAGDSGKKSYVKVTKLPRRFSDSAKMAIIEIIKES